MGSVAVLPRSVRPSSHGPGRPTLVPGTGLPPERSPPDSGWRPPHHGAGSTWHLSKIQEPLQNRLLSSAQKVKLAKAGTLFVLPVVWLQFLWILYGSPFGVPEVGSWEKLLFFRNPQPSSITATTPLPSPQAHHPEVNISIRSKACEQLFTSCLKRKQGLNWRETRETGRQGSLGSRAENPPRSGGGGPKFPTLLLLGLLNVRAGHLLSLGWRFLILNADFSTFLNSHIYPMKTMTYPLERGLWVHETLPCSQPNSPGQSQRLPRTGALGGGETAWPLLWFVAGNSHPHVSH